MMRDLIIAVIALCGGGFSAWLSDRYISTTGRNIALFAPIACAGCGRSREFWDRVPLLSWILNGGKCRFCGAVITLREPLISFFTIGIWLAALRLWMPCGKAYALINAVHASTLLCAAGICWIGASERPVLLPLLLCTGISGVLLPDSVSINHHLYGAAGLLLFGLMLRYLPQRIRGPEKIRWDTILYLGFTGLLLGWQSCFVILPAAVIMGALFMLMRKKTEISVNAGKNKGTVFSDPAPGSMTVSLCLTCAAAVTLLAGRPLMNWYLSIFAGIK